MKRILNILVLMSVTFMFVGCSSAANTSDSAVKDSTAPTITFSKKEVNLKAGESFNVPANIKVVDDTDGNLKEVKKIEEGKDGYVVDDEKVDLTKAGTYTVSVTAVDSSGNKAKSSFSVKVTEDKEEAETETESKETENTESKNESSSSNSSATNSSSASNSSASSSNSGSSGSTSKPSTGGSSSGSGSATKPSGGGSTPAPKPKPDCNDVVVVDKEAWDEKVLVKDAYDEQVLVKDAWDETVVTKAAWSEVVVVEQGYDVIHCRCGRDFTNINDYNFHDLNECDYGGYWVETIPAKTTFVDHPAETTTIHHDAEYKTVHHDAEYTTVHHDAKTHTEQVCS